MRAAARATASAAPASAPATQRRAHAPRSTRRRGRARRAGARRRPSSGRGGDDRQRGADRGAHRERERDRQRGHDQEPAADPEEAGEEADAGARRSGRAAAAVAGRRRPRAPRCPRARSSAACRQVAWRGGQHHQRERRRAAAVADTAVARQRAERRCPGSAAAVNEPRVAPADPVLARAWPTPPASAPAATITSDAVVASCTSDAEHVDENGYREHGSAAATRPRLRPIARPKGTARRGRRRRGPALDRVAGPSQVPTPPSTTWRRARRRSADTRLARHGAALPGGADRRHGSSGSISPGSAWMSW